MLWFQGAIPAAIASAKRSGAVFVVFVAGEGGGCPRYSQTPSPAYVQPQGPPGSDRRGLESAFPPPPGREVPFQPHPQSARSPADPSA